jgi:IS5 family transposase
MARSASAGGQGVVHQGLRQWTPAVDSELVDHLERRRAGAIVQGLLEEDQELPIHASAMTGRPLLEALVKLRRDVLDQNTRHASRFSIGK